ncbi:EAL domain-containing protein [Priestia taiwanensis]|uniref:Diguanylate phosphodiesterase n=1 Tax=Priestia taiwanensis TaxID=1347902 RepID=A0A917AR00_9BACI|nr:EAL domain-containing protein [Priestia taiwanensis]MBM7363060.1 EAL domain-containing protein (putative c-di-GMP-specific phosphodiesterase class I) [Priestia taiwanensis]GGE67294.1 diguanylate phosphodiesterase [Priestia taiwanensis]
MDALEIMANLDRVVPYYQPVFSADDHEVIGYEVLGYMEIDGENVSIGHFFLDESVPEDFRMEVDAIVLEKAIEDYMQTDQSFYLFINRNPNLLEYDEKEMFLEQLLRYEEQGLRLTNIIIQLTEHHFTGDLKSLRHLLTYYRTYGMKLAVDHIGKGNSNIRRVGMLAPDIFKVDLVSLDKEQNTPAYQDTLSSLPFLARKMGATILYEGIDQFYHLQYAWKNGGRYYQGRYLHAASPSFMDKYSLKDRLRQECHTFIVHEKKKLQAIQSYSDTLNERLNTFMMRMKKIDDYNKFLQVLAKEFSDVSFRMYVCDEDGFQKSANIEKEADGDWVLYPSYMMKNWSWRPYFLENIMKMRVNKKGRLSDLYTDIKSGETIRTFSYPTDDNDYIFMDIPYDYLYKTEGLLR